MRPSQFHKPALCDFISGLRLIGSSLSSRLTSSSYFVRWPDRISSADAAKLSHSKLKILLNNKSHVISVLLRLPVNHAYRSRTAALLWSFVQFQPESSNYRVFCRNPDTEFKLLQWSQFSVDLKNRLWCSSLTIPHAWGFFLKPVMPARPWSKSPYPSSCSFLHITDGISVS